VARNSTRARSASPHAELREQVVGGLQLLAGVAGALRLSHSP